MIEQYLFPVISVILLILFFKYYQKNKTIMNDLAVKERDLQSKTEELDQVSSRLNMVEAELNSSKENLTNFISENKSLQTRLEEKEKDIDSYSNRINKLDMEIRELNQNIIGDKALISELQTTIEKEREMSEEKLSLLREAKQQLTTEFENLGNKIFEDKSKKFTDQNKTNLEGLLNPLREQIKDFDKNIIQNNEQIKNLGELNKVITEETNNLTNALKGDTKTQGIWGELKLNRVLEMSGLREGYEYTTQDTFKSAEGKNYRPDVIINLPENKQVVIDSKVSLTGYERYSSAQTEEEKALGLKDHLNSLNNHIKGLSPKNYEDLEGINSLNYVLMFIPIESAFMLAIENDKDIFKNALDKNIILVCPSTLLATLRTIESIWQFEKQSRNAQDIANRAGKLYDRFVDFLNHMEKVGSNLTNASNSYDKAIKAIKDGRGNLVGQVKKLEELGAKNKKSIPEHFIDEEQDIVEKDELDNNGILTAPSPEA